MLNTIKLDLKTTILLSSLLAFTCNLVQSAIKLDSNARSSFAPSWAITSNNAPAAAPAPAKLAETAVTAAPPSAAGLPSAPDIAAKLKTAGLNPDYAGLYLAAQRATGTPWQLLAAIHRVETGQSGNTARTSWAGAKGPMQFMPATFARYAADGDGNGSKDITNVNDAVFTAAHMLSADGASHGQYTNAIYAYNHSYTYVGQVSDIYRRLGL